MTDSSATPWTVAYEVPQSMGFPRREYWSGLPLPSPGDFPNPGIKPVSPALQADASPSGLPRKPFFCEGPDNKFCMLCKPYRFHGNYSNSWYSTKETVDHMQTKDSDCILIKLYLQNQGVGQLYQLVLVCWLSKISLKVDSPVLSKAWFLNFHSS